MFSKQFKEFQICQEMISTIFPNLVFGSDDLGKNSVISVQAQYNNVFVELVRYSLETAKCLGPGMYFVVSLLSRKRAGYTASGQTFIGKEKTILKGVETMYPCLQYLNSFYPRFSLNCINFVPVGDTFILHELCKEFRRIPTISSYLYASQPILIALYQD